MAKLGVALDEVREMVPLEVLPEDAGERVRLNRVVDDGLRCGRDTDPLRARPKRQIHVLTGDGPLVEPAELLE